MIGGVLVLDFGSQVTQLIARRLREMEVYSELHPFNFPLEDIKKMKPAAIILSGGPLSVNEESSPKRDIQELREIAPVMGICYGMQLMAQQYGGIVEKAKVREYGKQYVNWTDRLRDIPGEQKVWMSHGDVVKVPPPGFKVLAVSDEDHPAAMIGDDLFAVQFHPEVSHTEYGLEVLKYFVFDVCNIEADWKAPNIAEDLMTRIREQVPEDEHVLVGLSGGVDSTVAARLCTKALGHERVHCVFINNGLLRKGEYEEVLNRYRKLGLNVTGVDAEKAFLKELKGVSDPEKKRKKIGHAFIKVFDHCVSKMDPRPKWLAQGTLYPDVIESVSPRGESVTIKTHHNVGGLPEKMNLKLLEPLRELFKDEVRAIGRELSIPDDSLWRHPFPGPGLAIRVLGAVDKESLDCLREGDAIFIEELKESGHYEKIWQAFAVLLPVQTVGVQGDARTYNKVLALRAVVSSDAMTADWYQFPHDFLQRVSNRITNEVEGVNRVVYDVTSKPPGTIEWE
ncbi:MAG: glutamine-hydrolyzing GMP synthase [Bdellovibrionales bacterium]|nr:glutamine-hydrolyzing GMP synthase [Bdellovibrionales bacterium]